MFVRRGERSANSSKSSPRFGHTHVVRAAIRGRTTVQSLIEFTLLDNRGKLRRAEKKKKKKKMEKGGKKLLGGRGALCRLQLLCSLL